MLRGKTIFVPSSDFAFPFFLLSPFDTFSRFWGSFLLTRISPSEFFLGSSKEDSLGYQEIGQTQLRVQQDRALRGALRYRTPLKYEVNIR